MSDDGSAPFQVRRLSLGTGQRSPHVLFDTTPQALISPPRGAVVTIAVHPAPKPPETEQQQQQRASRRSRKSHQTSPCGWRSIAKRWRAIMILLVVAVALQVLFSVLRQQAHRTLQQCRTSGGGFCTSVMPALQVFAPATEKETTDVRVFAVPRVPHPFTIMSLMRDMQTDAALHASRATLSEEEFLDELITHSLQWNALASWTRLVPSRHILLFMDKAESCARLTARAGLEELQCFPVPCTHPEFGKPLLDCLFHFAHAHARTDLIAYVNGDIILAETLSSAVSTVADAMTHEGFGDSFMLVSRRTDTPITEDMLAGFGNNDVRAGGRISNTLRIQSHAAEVGQLHSGIGIDLFLYHRSMLSLLHYDPSLRDKSLYPVSYDLTDATVAARAPEALHFPPFLAGVYRWDNWLLSEMISNPLVRVVDITESAAMGRDAAVASTIPTPLLVHQQLDPAVLGEKVAGYRAHQSRPGAKYNDALVKRTSKEAFKYGSIDNAALLLQPAEAGAIAIRTSTSEIVSDLRLQLKPNPHIAPIVLMRQRSTYATDPAEGLQVQRPDDEVATAEAPSSRPIGGWIALVDASSRDVIYVLNWLCWASRHDFTHFIFLARDRSIAHILARFDVPYVTPVDAPDSTSLAEDEEKSASFLEWRSRIVRDAMNGDLSVFLSSVRSVWPRSPLHLFYHLTHGSSHAGAAVAPADTEVWAVQISPKGKSKGPVLSASLLAFRPTALARYVWRQVGICITKELDSKHSYQNATRTGGGSASSSSNTRSISQLQSQCLSSTVWGARGNLKWAPLDPSRFMNSSVFLQMQPSDQTASVDEAQPYVIDFQNPQPPVTSEETDWKVIEQHRLNAVSAIAEEAVIQTEGLATLNCLPPPPPAMPHQ